jgi:hypothetical protein
MKRFADKHHTPRDYEIRDWVYLRLRPYRQMSVSFRRNLKLSPHYYCPFQITQKIGKVAYKLDLPPNSQIHPVFHVSLLKKQLGTRTIPLVNLPSLTPDGTLTPIPEKILTRDCWRRGTELEWRFSFNGLDQPRRTQHGRILVCLREDSQTLWARSFDGRGCVMHLLSEKKVEAARRVRTRGLDTRA